MPAKRYLVLLRALSVTSALCFAAAPRTAVAQAAPAADTTTTTTTTTTTSSDQGETTVLSPFVVDASEDKGSYKANSTLAGTRVRTDLNDVASAISVVTQQFLQDTGAKNSEDLLVYTPNTEVAGLQGNFTGQSGQPQFQEALTNPSSTTRVRGLDAADNTRDYFLTDIPWDGFDTGRIDLQRGPNSILFGVGSPAGIINNSINGAEFTTAYKFENRIGSYGSLRDSADINYVLIPNELAIRVSWVTDDEKYQQQPAFNDSTRFFAALRWDPVFFGKDNHTSVRANLERGEVSSNNPRALPPTDEITPWFQTGTIYGNPALNKATLNEWAIGAMGNGLGDLNSPSAFKFLPGFTQGRSYWPDVLSIYNGANSAGVVPPSSSTVTNAIAPLISVGYSLNSSGQVTGSGLGDLPQYRPVGIAPLSVFGQQSGTNAATVVIPSGGFFIDRVIQDSSIFNFYDHLLDGNNKKEWQNWTAGNVSLSQTFFNDRLAFELVYDAQKYVSGQYSELSQEQYSISVDPNLTLSDGSPNPNVGRPYTANADWAPSTNASTIDRESLRFTANYDLRFEDLLGKGTASEILGHHVFTGLADEDRKNSSSLGWSEYASDANYPAVISPSVTLDSLTTYRQFDFINYLGPSLAGRASAAGANISPVTNIIAPSSQVATEVYNSHWNKPTNPTDPNYVNPGAAFTYINHSNGSVVNGHQSDNPANYVGWQVVPVNFLNANNPSQFNDLIITGLKTKYTDVNQGITWQGYLFDNTFVPVFGYRKDSVTNYATSASETQNPTSGLIDPNYSIDPKTRTSASGDSKSWGGVYHFPKFLTSALPWGTTFSVFYDRSSNFKADVPRDNILGGVIPNPQGKTKEYGFTISTLNDKLSFKVDWYNTLLSNATLDSSNGNSIGGLGSNGYFAWAAPTWGMAYAAQLQDGLQGINPNNSGNWNYLANDGTPNNGVGDPVFDNSPQTAQSKQIVNAWLHFPLGASFFQFYSIHPLPIDPALGLASGNIRSDFGPGYTEAINIGGEQWLGSINAVTTSDVLSKGEEFELVAQPTKNWNITVNYSRTFATHENVDPTTAAFMANQFAFFSGVGGDLRLWGGGGGNTTNGFVGGNAIGPMWIRNIYNPYLVEVATEGHSAPEIAPWRFNLVTSYSFDRGPLKGYFVGGADRMEAGRILGYAFDPTTNFLNVNNPWVGSTDTHVDGWVGYSRRVFANKVNWRIQLNLRNIGEKAHLVADAVEPDGSIGLARIQDGMTWTLTNTFDF